MITKEQIISLANEAMKDTDRFVVNATVSSDNVIEVFIDADSSVTIDNCVDVSRYIEDHLDRDAEDFELSVSSAGIDEPLLLDRQYAKYVGKELIITKNDGIKKMYKLVSCTDGILEVQEAETKKYGKLTKVVYHENENIAIENIKETRPYIKF